MAKPPEPPRHTRVIGAILGALGSFPAILIAVTALILWGLSGFLIGFTNTWQLIINTSTTIITFLMVFVIQNSQNRDSRAMETKLDAIMQALEGVDDTLTGIEDLPEGEIKERQQQVRKD